MTNSREETDVRDEMTEEDVIRQEVREDQRVEDIMHLEEVESDEYFTDDETNHASDTQILFGDSKEKEEIDRMVNDYFSTSEDDSDNEGDEEQSDFRSGYNMRMKNRRVWNTLSSTEPQHQRRSQDKGKSKKKKGEKVRNSYAFTAPTFQTTSHQIHRGTNQCFDERTQVLCHIPGEFL